MAVCFLPVNIWIRVAAEIAQTLFFFSLTWPHKTKTCVVRKCGRLCLSEETSCPDEWTNFVSN